MIFLRIAVSVPLGVRELKACSSLLVTSVSSAKAFFVASAASWCVILFFGISYVVLLYL